MEHQSIHNNKGDRHARAITRASSRNAKNGVQAKLTVTPSDDVYEQEADKIAERVIGMAPSSTGKGLLPISPFQSQGKDDRTPAPSSFEHYTDNLNGSGQPLMPDTQAFFESRFGQDFSDVRIHTDNRAAESSEAISAHAFTLGNNIVFNEGQYAPHGYEGKKLLAHELTHIVQQSGGAGNDQGTSQQGSAGAAQGQSIQKEGSDDDDSWLSSIGKVVGGVNDMTGGAIPMLGMAGNALSGAGDLGKGIGSGEAPELAAGAMGFGSSALEMAKTMGETGETLGEGAISGLGTAAGVLDVGKSAVEAYSDFSKGKIGAGIGDVVEGTGSALRTGAELGGFNLSGALSSNVGSLLGMGGGEAGAAGAGTAGVAGAETAGVAGAEAAGIAGAETAGVAGAEAVGAEVAGTAVAGAGATAAGVAGAVIGSGIAGWEAGKALDKGVNWVGQKITGDDKGDYSISGGLASTMTAADNALTPLWADPSKPAYTQTLGWKLGELFGG